MKIATTVILTVIILTMAYGHNSYTGYAGSPVSSGSCAASCHGGPNSFTPTVTNWPAAYTPGQSYTIVITHNGNSMSNFNACVLRQSNNAPAGILSGGSNTETYSHSGEGIGVHGTTNNQTSYTFNWQAPSSGTGIVNLYVAVHRLGAGGPNGVGVFSSNQSGIEELTTSASDVSSFSVLSGNPLTSDLRISLNAIVSSYLKLTLHDITGEIVDVLLDEYVSTGTRIITYRPKVNSGIYFLNLADEKHAIGSRKIIMVK